MKSMLINYRNIPLNFENIKIKPFMCISAKYYIFKIHYNTNKLSRALKQLFNVILYINMMSMIIMYFIRNANTFNFPLLMNFY